MSNQHVEFVPSSDRSLLVRLDGASVPRLLRALEASSISGVVNLHPAYCSMLVVFDPLALNHAELQARLTSMVSGLADEPPIEPRTVEIPVHYDGPDLEDVAAMHGMTSEQVVAMHSGAAYTVRFLGFLPGFAYLSGLPDELATPRLESPRVVVPAGSVGIAGLQTGVYPFDSPGGWRLIGRTETVMFRDDSLLHVGDRVKFVPV